MNTCSRPKRIARIFACILLLPSAVAPAQSAPQPKRALTPDQIAYQQASAAWLEQYNKLRRQAQQPYNAEIARQKTEDCPDANSTRAQEQCLSHEIGITQANFAAVTTPLRAMLALEHPTMPGEPPYSGPTGTPPTAAERLAEFDQLEAASAAYRKLAATAAYNEYTSGSLAPVVSAEAELRLLRMHLQELAFIYDGEFSNR